MARPAALLVALLAAPLVLGAEPGSAPSGSPAESVRTAPAASPAASPADSGKAVAPPASQPDSGKAVPPPASPADSGKSQPAGGAKRLGRGALEQPIPFSHRIHAGDNRIGCLMCHAYAEHGRFAGIPSMARCAGCHKFIDRQKPGVKRVMDAFRKKQVISWNRVYRLQDFVYFTHERHLAAGLPCATCHGEVPKMDVLRPARALTMGWCVDCHRSRGVRTDCVLCHK